MPKKKKYLSGKDLQQALFIRTEGYAANVRTIYQNAFTQIIDIVKGTYLVDGKPFSFSEYGYTDEVQPILRRMYSLTYQTIRGGIQKEWMFAAENNDELVKSIFGEHSISDPHFARYFLRNREAMDAFFARKKEGLNLSQNVWKYTGQFKGELENTLDLAIGEGTPANQLAARVKEYLNDPDRWYRRFRIKIGEDEDGNPIYARKWKRRIFNQEDGIYQWIDDDPRDYHPGRGVYRSSARNAQRLARTETNIAYRASDYERWAQLDFVVGIEIKVSKNHPDPDICDDLQGKYPKDFKWTGWHPNCRCYMIPVLATEDEAFDIADKLASEDDPGSVHSENTVDDVPEGFKKWIQDPKTQERMEKAEANGTMPYFIKDNPNIISKAISGLTPEEQKALTYADLLVDPIAILKKFDAPTLDQLYDAVKKGLDKMLKGDLDSQKHTLEFEINWVKDKKKYATWRECADAYQKALDKVNHQIEVRNVRLSASDIDKFIADHPKSKKVKAIQKQIQEALDKEDLLTAKTLIADARKEIDAYIAKKQKEAMKKLAVTPAELEEYIKQHYTSDFTVTSQDSYDRVMQMLGNSTKDVWQGATEEQRAAFPYYTDSSAHSRRILTNVGLGKHEPYADLMDSILDKIRTTEDMVLRSGQDYDVAQYVFGEDFKKLLAAGNLDELNAKFGGTVGVNKAYMSTSFNQHGGFTKQFEVHIFAPKGTHCMNLNEISAFGHGKGTSWDGYSYHKTWESTGETEIFLHRGYKWKFIKAEAGTGKGGRTRIYVQLLDRAV